MIWFRNKQGLIGIKDNDVTLIPPVFSTFEWLNSKGVGLGYNQKIMKYSLVNNGKIIMSYDRMQSIVSKLDSDSIAKVKKIYGFDLVIIGILQPIGYYLYGIANINGDIIVPCIFKHIIPTNDTTRPFYSDFHINGIDAHIAEPYWKKYKFIKKFPELSRPSPLSFICNKLIFRLTT